MIPFDTTQITSAANRSNPKNGDPCHPLMAAGHPPSIAFHTLQDPISSIDLCHAIGAQTSWSAAVAQPMAYGIDGDQNGSEELIGTLRSHGYESARVAHPITQYGNIAGSLTARHDSSPCADRGQNVVAQPMAYGIDGDQNGSEELIGTLRSHHYEAARVAHPVASALTASNEPSRSQCSHCAAFFSRFSCAAITHGECDCPKCQGYCKCKTQETKAICIKGAAIGRKPEAGPQYGETLAEASYTLNCVDRHGVMTPAMQVRRLTPVECERLQGFPDNYTNIPWRKKPEAPDGPRYKALGNSMAVPVMRWIGQRIKENE